MKRTPRFTGLPALALCACTAVIFGACTLDELDLRAKQCPCAAGWTCDRSTNSCQQGDAGVDAGG